MRACALRHQSAGEFIHDAATLFRLRTNSPIERAIRKILMICIFCILMWSKLTKLICWSNAINYMTMKTNEQVYHKITNTQNALVRPMTHVTETKTRNVASAYGGTDNPPPYFPGVLSSSQPPIRQMNDHYVCYSNRGACRMEAVKTNGRLKMQDLEMP